VDLGAQLQKPRRHGLAKAGAASGHEDAPPGEKLIVEHRFYPRDSLLIDRLTKTGNGRSVKRQEIKDWRNSHGTTRFDLDFGRDR
jgi:hypothetical protein